MIQALAGKPAENWGEEIAGCQGVRGNVSGQWRWQAKAGRWGAGLGGFSEAGQGGCHKVQEVRGNMRGRYLNNPGPCSHGVLQAGVGATGVRLSVGEFELGTM